MTERASRGTLSGGWQGAGIWNLYFLAKFALLWGGYIELKPIENAALLGLILLPLRSKLARSLRAAAVGVGAFCLIWSESWLPGPEAIQRNLGNLANFSPEYLLELIGASINVHMLEAAFAVFVIWMLLRSWIRFTVLTIAGLVFFSIPSWKNFVHQEPIPLEAGTEARLEQELREGTAASPALETDRLLPTQTEAADDQGINRWRDRFYAAERERRASIPDTASVRDFDIAIVNICSLSTDDLEAAGLEKHPVFSRFDARFENFNSATSYSGPASLRLMRSVCGQPSHDALYNERSTSCELFSRLEHAGFRSTFYMDHNGQFEGYLASLRERAGFAAPLADQKNYRLALTGFDNSNIYRTADVLRDWLKSKPVDGKATAAFFNLIALHDGNRALGSFKSMPFKPRAENLLNDLNQVMTEIESSGRKVLFLVVPEHGAAVRGDKIQMPRLREIPSPKITHVPVLVKFFGLPQETRPQVQIRVEERTSYLAVADLIGRTISCDPWSNVGTCRAEDLLKQLPQTWSVSENTGAAVLEYQNRWKVKLPGDKWIDYPQ